VAGTPNSRTLVAFAPLLSHATARPRQASTSFGSQARPAGRRLQSQLTGTSQRYDLAHCHPGQAAPSTPVSVRRLLARVTSTVPGLSPRAGPTCRCAGSVQGNQCCPGLSLPSTGRRPCPLRARLNGEPESSTATHGQSQYPLTCIAAALLSRRRSLPSWSYQPRAGPWAPHPHQAIRLPLSPLQHGRGDRFARQGQVLAAVEP
jgi:hypothetical protein